jgi:CBS domain-containing protein
MREAEGFQATSRLEEGAESMRAKDIMTKGVITFPLDMSVADAQQLLLRYRIHGAPVVGPDDQLVGSASYVDLLGGSGERVSDVMAPNPSALPRTRLSRKLPR